MVEKVFSREKVNMIVFVKHKRKNILLVQVYVDDIIFGTTNEFLCRVYWDDAGEFEMSMIGELNYFFGL